MRTLIFSLAFFISCFCGAQNLVPNPSFEEHSDCPSNQGQIDLATGWSSAGSSPDYYHTCSDYLACSVPYHWAGYQQPHIGDAYSGIYTHFIKADLREYIQVQLIEPLSIGEVYSLSFWVNRGFDGEIAEQISCSTNGLGAMLKTEFTSTANPILPTNNPIAFEDEIISDTVSWNLLEFQFQADSAYQYLLIGNFFDDNNTQFELEAGNQCHGYYFIDDVYLATTVGVVDDIDNSFPLNCYPLPLTELLHLDVSHYLNNANVSIVNVVGEELIRTTVDRTPINVSMLGAGHYTMIVWNESARIFIHLIK